jgi:exopolysaccharide production protein ExoZ
MEFRFQAHGPAGEPPQAPGHLPAIQMLRAVAALAIALLHVFHDAETISVRMGGSFSVGSSLPLAAGVDLFFVISGFVMIYASRDAFGSAASIGPFLRRRAARIIPIYWAVTLVYLVISLGGLGPLNRPKPDGWEIAASFLFIPWLTGSGPLIQPVYSLGWTLNYEMMFYVLFALALPLRRSLAVPVVVGLLMVLAFAGQFVPASNVQVYFWTRSIILEFAFGMIIGQMALAGVKPGKSLAVAIVVVSIVLLWLAATRPQLFPDRALMFGLPSALLVIAALAFNDMRTNSLPARLGIRLGDASYAIYLLHPFVIRGLSVGAGGLLVGLSPWIYIGLALGTTCMVAIAAWLWFERPITKVLQGPRARG